MLLSSTSLFGLCLAYPLFKLLCYCLSKRFLRIIFMLLILMTWLLFLAFSTHYLNSLSLEYRNYKIGWGWWHMWRMPSGRNKPGTPAEMPGPRPKTPKMAPKAVKGPKGMSKPLESGTVMFDLVKKPWAIGKVIGQGGFGYLYLGSSGASAMPMNESADYVIKVEPHSNGPLFSELAFYQRVAKPELMSAWMRQHKISHLGVPRYIASGYFEQKAVKYRFMVMDRFGKDVEKLFDESNRKFSVETAFTLGLQIIDVLEFIHEQEYVHADIKSSNLMMGASKGTEKQVYVLDYGLAYRYCPNGKHVLYKEDPKRKHDGTLLYTSIDAHKGCAPSRRGDLEILGYCLTEWLCGRLPWGDILSDKVEDKVKVMSLKIDCMKDISAYLQKCFKSGPISDELRRYLELVKKMAYDEKPNYEAVRSIFCDGLRRSGVPYDGKVLMTKVSQKRSSTSVVESPSPPKKRAIQKNGSPQARAAPPATTPKRTAPKSDLSPPSQPAKRASPRRRSLAAKKVDIAKRTLAKKSLEPGRQAAAAAKVSSREHASAGEKVIHRRQRRRNVPTRDFGQSP